MYVEVHEIVSEGAGSRDAKKMWAPSTVQLTQKKYFVSDTAAVQQ